MSLPKFLNELNATAKAFNTDAIDIVTPTTVAQCNDLLGQVEGCLSPENLTRDGEAAPAQVNARSKMLNAAKKSLTTLSTRLAAKAAKEEAKAKADAEKAELAKKADAEKAAKAAAELEAKANKAPSKAQQVRDHIQSTFKSRAEADAARKEIIDQAMTFGLRTRGAAAQCVTNNITRVFGPAPEVVEPEATEEVAAEEQAEA